MAGAVQALGCPVEKIRIHHLGIRTEEIPFRPRTWDPCTPLRALIAGGFVEKKGIPVALAAIARIRARSGIDIRVVLVGDARRERRSLKEKERIEEAIGELGLEAVTERHGFVSHSVLHDLASTAHVLLAPSLTAKDGDTEGGAPVVLMEMAASGLPIVSTRHCDIPEVILDGETGWLARERDVESLAACISNWTSRPDGWGSFLAAGRKRMEERYQASRQASLLACQYRELAAMRRPLRSRNGA
jgi:colanic acid/amylovoran biosynthesis glycosyltransferase